jgi:hypothetical protein
MEQPEIASALNWLHWLTILKYVGGALVVIGVASERLGFGHRSHIIHRVSR